MLLVHWGVADERREIERAISRVKEYRRGYWPPRRLNPPFQEVIVRWLTSPYSRLSLHSSLPNEFTGNFATQSRHLTHWVRYSELMRLDSVGHHLDSIILVVFAAQPWQPDHRGVTPGRKHS